MQTVMNICVRTTGRKKRDYKHAAPILEARAILGINVRSEYLRGM